MLDTQETPTTQPVSDPGGGAKQDAAKAQPARRLSGGRLLWPALVLAALLIFNAVFSPGFFQIRVLDGHLFGSLIDILNRGAPLVVLSMGMTLVIATGGVDLSVGSVMAIAGAIAACLAARPDFSPVSALNVHGSVVAMLCISLLVALLAGIWNGVLVAIIDIQPIVATLILMVAGRGIAQLLTDGQVISFENPHFAFLGGGFLLGLPFPVTIAVIAVVLTGLLARATAFGLFVESVGNNPTASHYAGVNARFVKLAAYAFCGLVAGVAGLIMTADNNAADVNNIGLYWELDAILAVCIGGTALTGGRFSLAGTAVGAVLIQTLNTTILSTKIAGHGIPGDVRLVVKAIVIIGVCLLQSEVFRNKTFKLLGRRRP